jgi:hypothetical protein
MNRRRFLSLFTAGVAGIALDQAIPLGRVWSFPKKIVVPDVLNWPEDFPRKMLIGSTVRIRMPQRWFIHEALNRVPQGIVGPQNYLVTPEGLELTPADRPPARQ